MIFFRKSSNLKKENANFSFFICFNDFFQLKNLKQFILFMFLKTAESKRMKKKMGCKAHGEVKTAAT